MVSPTITPTDGGNNSILNCNQMIYSSTFPYYYLMLESCDKQSAFLVAVFVPEKPPYEYK